MRKFFLTMWFLYAIVSALFLGIYDVLKKVSVNDNAVFPVLLVSTMSSAFLFLPVFILSNNGILNEGDLLFIPHADGKTHLFIFAKAVLVLTSWIFSFFALKHLPLTVVSPIRATGPLWTLIGAILIFGEQLNMLQWIGLIITLAFFYLFSTIGKLEGLSLKNNKWFWFIILATLTGAASGLYDKYLMTNLDRMAVQSWFSVYQALLMVPIVYLVWYPQRSKHSPFKFRWSIPLVGIMLVIADFAYFYALSNPEALISVISALRRGSVIIAFVFGAILFKEKNIKQKAIYLTGILTGILLLLLGSM
ncbi:EamA family transporter [Carboxylicivirga caseinilyticus]|uniref:EamA family transporter n=1 Tax=Carboxylicivirga caseinilyticus TaxID=3417572 RepID=UPI003D3517D4